MGGLKAGPIGKDVSIGTAKWFNAKKDSVLSPPTKVEMIYLFTIRRSKPMVMPRLRVAKRSSLKSERVRKARVQLK